MNDVLQSIAKLHSIDSSKSFNKTWDKEVAVFHIFVFSNYFLPSVLKHQQDKGNVLGRQLLTWVALGLVRRVVGGTHRHTQGGIFALVLLEMDLCVPAYS